MTELQHQTLTLNGVEYVRKDLVPPSIVPLSSKRIVIADRGWVFAGDCVDNTDGTVTIHNCSNIRKWGTSRGLGELVNGPLTHTAHDAYGTVKCLPLAQINVVKGWGA